MLIYYLLIAQTQPATGLSSNLIGRGLASMSRNNTEKTVWLCQTYCFLREFRRRWILEAGNISKEKKEIERNIDNRIILRVKAIMSVCIILYAPEERNFVCVC